MLNVIKYLINATTNAIDKSNDINEALKKLSDVYSIKVTHHKKYPNLVELKYNQVNSPLGDPLVQECRGLILDTTDNWRIIAFPFTKFFSYGEFYADHIDWSSAKYLEKIDGSLMNVYWYDNAYHVASSSIPDASGLVNDKTKTFNDLFWEAWKNLHYDYPTNKTYTYMFEMTSPLTQVIVPQNKNNIRFIGLRDNITCKEISIYDIDNNWDKPKIFPITSIDDAKNICKYMNPMKQEGFVITDKYFHRVKLKSPQYPAIANLGLTLEEINEKGLDPSKYDKKVQEKWILKIILTNENSEFLTYYPQYTSLYNEIHKKYLLCISDLTNLYDKAKNITDQKNFAKTIRMNPLCGILFNIRCGKIKSIQEGLLTINIGKLQNALYKYKI